MLEALVGLLTLENQPGHYLKKGKMNKLPTTVARFFEASNKHEIDPMASCFAVEATVHDVGEDLEIKGLPDIKAWLKNTRIKYNLQTTPLEVKGSAEDTEVLAEVAGTFDGSPLKFRYRFKLNKELITFLSTTYVE